jgi:hypothetical protein
MNKTKKHIRPLSSTRKKRQPINGKILYRREGWIGVEVHGTPYEIGFAHGRLLRGHFPQVVKVLKYLVDDVLKTTLPEYVKTCKTVLKRAINLVEWGFIKEEIRGICDGCAHPDITFDFLVAWNAYLSMCYYSKYRNVKTVSAGRCSAFIATGKATDSKATDSKATDSKATDSKATGKATDSKATDSKATDSKATDSKATGANNIVMAHNTHCDLASGFVCNIVMRIRPDGKIPFVMQTSPGLVCSSADWFLSSSGIIGCETTITAANYDADFEHGVPYFFRIRKAMETGQTLDDYVSIMEKQNAGDYPCSWLLGDTNSGAIMRLELTKNAISVATTNDGVYYGMNSAISPEIRLLETNDSGMNDLMKSSGSRNSRLEYLLMDKYYGKINTTTAKKIIADHYDSGKNQYRMGIRGICKHRECEENEDFALSGVTDGKVVDSKMAQELNFEGIFGSSCGRPFKRKDYVKKMKDAKLWKDALQDMPKYNWVGL